MAALLIHPRKVTQKTLHLPADHSKYTPCIATDIIIIPVTFVCVGTSVTSLVAAIAGGCISLLCLCVCGIVTGIVCYEQKEKRAQGRYFILYCICSTKDHVV